MNKKQWEFEENSEVLFSFLESINYKNKSKLRLIAVACARKVQHLMTDVNIKTLDVAEAFAKGEATEGELRSAAESAHSTAWNIAQEAAALSAESAARLRHRSSLLLSAAESADAESAWYAAQSAARSAADTARYAAKAAECCVAKPVAKPAAGAAVCAVKYDDRPTARKEQCDIIRKFIKWKKIKGRK